MNSYFATTPKGLEELLVEELTDLGAVNLKRALAGVGFDANQETVYRILMWSRLASRIVQPIAVFEARDTDAVYAGIADIDWGRYMTPDSRFIIDVNLTGSTLTHDRFVAQRVKDAVVDQFRDRTGRRPTVDREAPDLRLNINVRRDRLQVALDLSGTALSNRGYRLGQGQAPLRENLAAAILLRAGWPKNIAPGGALIDPMCGAGTLLIEGALMAADAAPGLTRPYYGAWGLPDYDAGLWSRVKADAEARREAGIARLQSERTSFGGFDADARVLRHAEDNARRAGINELCQWGTRDIARWKPANTRGWKQGLVVVNPPYGERLGEAAELPALYGNLGRVLADAFKGWQAAVFTGNPELGKRMGIRARKVYKLFNGPLPCNLLCFDVAEEWLLKHGGKTVSEGAMSEGAASFRNRLKKNLKTISAWARKNQVEAYRIYDADIPEYNVAVDRYGEVVVVSEYAPPTTVDQARAEKRLQEVLMVVPQVLETPPERLALKQRKKRKFEDRDSAPARRGELVPVKEAGLTFLINPWDYLDVGLFNDHRPIRARIRREASGKHFLNLFAYTGSVTVAAAVGGAASTTTVDLSQTYLEWAERNLKANGVRIDGRHQLVRADCLSWVETERGSYDLIFLDPPTFSNSKAFEGSLDIQRDHVDLIRDTARLLSRDGLLIFSNNFRKFKMDTEGLSQAGLSVTDITADTIPEDFARNPKIHQCFEIRKR